MHPIIFYIAVIWLALLFAVCVILIIRAPTVMIRVLILDTLNLILMALLALLAITTRSAYYLDAVFLLALLSFLSTLAAARYYSEGKLFS